MSTDPRIGTRIGPYEIEQLVGRGGMGVVYAGRHMRLNRRAAIKVLAPELAGDGSFRERFIRESELAAQLDHPNIIPIYDADESGGLLFIAMRFVRGADLKALLANQMRLPVDRTLETLEQVASALDYAHENGLVHRDVKPGNIMIEHLARGGDRVFLTDFGLVRRVDATSRLTKVGSFVGTLAYAAPEQFEGGEVDGRADLYSLACVLYECLSGAVPFDRDSEAQVMFAHISEPPPHLTQVDASLPRGLDDVFQRAMAKAPAGRFTTCGEMIAVARAQVGTTSLAGAPALPAAPPMPAAVAGPAPVAHPPGTPGWPQPLEPRHVAYTGRQYEIGSEGSSYAIWNRGAGGPALQRFPQTPAGWAEAWRHYQFWERIDSDTPARQRPPLMGDVSPAVRLSFVVLTIVCGVAAGASCFLPWASFAGLTFNAFVAYGARGTGIAVLGIGLIVAGILAANPRPDSRAGVVAGWLGVVAGAGIVLLALVAIAAPPEGTNAQFGAFIAAAVGLAAMVASIVGLRRRLNLAV